MTGAEIRSAEELTFYALLALVLFVIAALALFAILGRMNDRTLPPPAPEARRDYWDVPGGGHMRSGWRS